MSKLLIILVLFLILLAIIAFRYRKQIQTAYIMWQTYRRFRKQMKPPATQKKVEKKTTSKDTELVRCPKCNKWTPQEDAVKLKSNYYCSHSCMEESLSFSN